MRTVYLQNSFNHILVSGEVDFKNFKITPGVTVNFHNATFNGVPVPNIQFSNGTAFDQRFIIDGSDINSLRMEVYNRDALENIQLYLFNPDGSVEEKKEEPDARLAGEDARLAGEDDCCDVCLDICVIN